MKVQVPRSQLVDNLGQQKPASNRTDPDTSPSRRGRGLQLVVTGCTGPICDLSGTVVSGVGEAEFNGPVHPIHERFLNGSYGLQFTKSSPTPATGAEVWTFDSKGNVTMTGTFVAPGPNLTTEPPRSGTYCLNSDGMGAITFPPPPGGVNSQTYVFVTTDGRSGLMILQTNRAGNGVLYGTGRLQ